MHGSQMTLPSGVRNVSTDLTLQRSQWFYDDSGYYSYVLLNVSEVEYSKVQQILKDSGLRVLLASRSYRPASNGVQYQWYIRVSDEAGKHPSLKRIEQVLAAREPVKGEEVVPKDEELRKLKAVLAEKERQYQVAIGRLESSRKQIQELHGNYERTQLELTKYQKKVNDLESQLLQIQETTLKPEDVDAIHQKYESAIRELRQELGEKQAHLDSWMSNFEPEIHEREQKITALHGHIMELQNQIAILREEKDRLIVQFQDARATRAIELEREDPEYLFREMLHVLLPNIELLGGTTDTLWREMQNPIRTLEQLTNLGQLKAKRVQRTNDWLERHIEGDWRLYFRKSEDSKYQVLISHKNTQETDIKWLMLQ